MRVLVRACLQYLEACNVLLSVLWWEFQCQVTCSDLDALSPQSNATDWPHIHNLQIKYGEVWELIWEGADNVSNALNQILDCQIISVTIIVDISRINTIDRGADTRRR